MDALYIQPLEEDGVMTEEVERGRRGEHEKGGNEALSLTGSTTEEETDEDSEPEPPPVVRRKVSFADAFGLNLVSVKEFDDVEVESEVSQPPEMEATHPLEEFYMSCLFTAPSSPEELDQRLQVQMIELESIELLPGTTTLRGTIRVVNLCYSKSVYARITLDCWNSYFDLLAEYVPGSSDMKTDRFTFKYTLIPPFERQGTRLEFCLRYDTSVGTFWANNKDINYVLFLHQKGQVKEQGSQVLEESPSYKSKRSCLRANRRGSAEEQTKEAFNTATVSTKAKANHKAEEAARKTVDNTDIQSLLYHEEHKLLVDSVKSRHRATRLARVRDYLSQKRQHVPKAYSHDSAGGQKVSQPVPAPRSDSASCLYNRLKKQPNESPQVLTYHQIPLLTLDWNNDKPRLRGAADTDDIWARSAKLTLSKASEEKIEDTPSVSDIWETFLNGTDDTTDKETSVCDVWQEFLNGPSSKDHSGVPESEWLQTAASVSPSNDKEPQIQYAASSQEFQEFQVGTDTSTTLQAHTSAASQLLSDKLETPLANVSLITEDDQPAEACVSSPRDDNTVTRDASQRSQTNSVIDTSQEFCLEGATPVSEGSVDSSAECHEHAIWEQEREGIIGEAEGIGGDEPFMLHTADLVTSSGESKTTDMTVMPESQNASTVDRISQGARLDEGLSSRGEGEVTGTAHNAMDDTLAFKETIRQGTKDGERFVFSTSRQRAEEGIVTNCTENKVSREEEIFRPHETEECEISQRYADEKQCEEFRLNQKSKNPLQEKKRDENEIGPAQSHAHEFNPNQTCEENFRPSLVMESEFNLDELENRDMASINKEGSRETQMENSYCEKSNETKRLIGAEAEIICELDEEALRHNDEALQLNSSGNTSIISEIHNKWGKQTGEELYVQKEEEDATLTQVEENMMKTQTGEHVLASNQTEEGKSLSNSKISIEQHEINLSAQSTHTVESGESTKVFQSDHDTFRPFPPDKCNSNPTEVVEVRWISSQDVMKGQREDVVSEISQGEVIAKENVAKKDNSTELQNQPETIERIEADMSQRDIDERVSIGELKTVATGELMGNVEGPQGERKNAPAELKEQELSAEGESFPHVEYKKPSEGTKEPIKAENIVALEVMESRVEEMFIERFGEDLVRDIWEEVFGQRAQASKRDTNITDGVGADMGLADIPDITCDCHLLFEKDVSDAFDSGIFSLTELPTDPNLSLCQGLEETIMTNSNEYSPKERSQSVTTIEQTPFLSELQTDLNLSAHLSQDLTSTLAALSRQSLTKSAQTLSPLRDQENCSQIKNRSLNRQETGRQIEDCVVAHKENFNRSVHPSHKHLSPSSEKLKESDGLVCWSILYMLSHITRLLICGLLVAGFFVIIFLYDFPAFFAFYIFSLSWWFYKWKSHRMTMKRGIGHEFAERRESVKECSV
ncbi:uncharacterized protein LOC111663615 [Seriola lalandi dorsalis]|uniref:uncharacterized protein LOC111663615 n=1 Tax=Seriola lalandi dorsalis TaxID=1841481 RepID=UPI000C6F7C26|nr:uncharacterized protein LOC111663615 [Seriola lalandi dorsalis]